MVVVLELTTRSGVGIGIGRAKQVLGKLWQLAGPEQRLRIDHEGRQHLGIAVLLRMQIEHKANQRPFQPRPSAHVDCKPRTAQLRRPLQIQNPESVTDLPMRLRLKIEDALLAPGLHRDVVRL